MVAKKSPTKSIKKRLSVEKQDSGTPAFPYTTEPQALKRLLAEIPKRPKPPKMTLETIKAWSVSNNNNASSAVRVLKKIGLLQESGQPTDYYADFMKAGTGSAVLGQRIKEVYRVLFENSLSPQTASTEELRSLFNIHSGGGEDAMRLQIQTFKTLAEFATFTDSPVSGRQQELPIKEGGNMQTQSGALRVPPVQIDLHIHLPENKSSREYEAIIQDIAKYIYGKDIE